MIYPLLFITVTHTDTQVIPSSFSIIVIYLSNITTILILGNFNILLGNIYNNLASPFLFTISATHTSCLY